VTAARDTSITERLADYVVGIGYDDLPPAVVDKAKELLVYQLGLALRGRSTRAGMRAVGVALELSGSERGCSVVGERLRAALPDAVLANSALMTSSGLTDLLFPGGALPGHVVHPAAWAVGELSKASGRELITAVVLGYDVMGKLHNGRLPYELEVPRPTKAAVEPFGVAATAARLLGLSREQTVDALGHAGQTVMGLYEGPHAELMHPLAARNGVQAAVFAKSGIPAPRTVVEGPYGVYRTFFLEEVPDNVYDQLATLGTDFALAGAWTTRYPVSSTNAHPIELTRRLVAEHCLTPGDVAAVDLVLPASREAREAIYGVYPKGPTSVVAIALTDGRLDPVRLEEEFDADLLAVRDRVRLRFEDGHGFFYARIEVATTDGRRLAAEAGGDLPADQPPLDWAEWLDTSRCHILSIAQVERLIALIRELESVTDVNDVLACLVPMEAAR
jgi:2-methylcitrate dehydratase